MNDSYNNNFSQKPDTYTSEPIVVGPNGINPHGGSQPPGGGRRGRGRLAALITSLCILFASLGGIGGAYFVRYLDGGHPGETDTGDSPGTSQTGGTLSDLGINYQPASSNPPQQNGSVSITDVVDFVKDTVVEIMTETVVNSSRFNQYVSSGAGSGVIITGDGYIVTNHHVVSGANTVRVRLTDGTEYTAEVIGYDEDSDIAVIKIDAGRELKAAVVGDSSKLRVGEDAIVIGNPLGNLGGTVTNGIISALDREITIDGYKMTLLQTNAAVNPGNSGGGMFNIAGQLIGIINAKSSGSDIEGLGFAIPINKVTEVIEQIIRYGFVRGKVDLGLSLLDITDYYTAMIYRVNSFGVYVYDSQINSEIKQGDKITEINGAKVGSTADMKQILADCKVGQKITITLERDSKEVKVEIECLEYIPEGIVLGSD